MTNKQAKTLAAVARAIRKQTDRAFIAIDDDPMFGELWSALNRIGSDADFILSEVTPTR